MCLFKKVWYKILGKNNKEEPKIPDYIKVSPDGHLYVEAHELLKQESIKQTIQRLLDSEITKSIDNYNKSKADKIYPELQ